METRDNREAIELIEKWEREDADLISRIAYLELRNCELRLSLDHAFKSVNRAHEEILKLQRRLDTALKYYFNMEVQAAESRLVMLKQVEFDGNWRPEEGK